MPTRTNVTGLIIPQAEGPLLARSQQPYRDLLVAPCQNAQNLCCRRRQFLKSYIGNFERSTANLRVPLTRFIRQQKTLTNRETPHTNFGRCQQTCQEIRSWRGRARSSFGVPFADQSLLTLGLAWTSGTSVARMRFRISPHKSACGY